MKKPLQQFKKGDEVIARNALGEELRGRVHSVHWHIFKSHWQYTIQLSGTRSAIRVFAENELMKRERV